MRIARSPAIRTNTTISLTRMAGNSGTVWLVNCVVIHGNAIASGKRSSSIPRFRSLNQRTLKLAWRSSFCLTAYILAPISTLAANLLIKLLACIMIAEKLRIKLPRAENKYPGSAPFFLLTVTFYLKLCYLYMGSHWVGSTGRKIWLRVSGWLLFCIVVEIVLLVVFIGTPSGCLGSKFLQQSWANLYFGKQTWTATPASRSRAAHGRVFAIVHFPIL